MYIRLLPIAIAVLLLTSTCLPAQTQQPTPDNRTAIELIYSQIIFCDFAIEGWYVQPDLGLCAEEPENVATWSNYCSPDSPLTLNSNTFAGFLSSDDWQWVKGHFSSMKKQTWDNFVKINATSEPVKSSMKLDCPYQLASLDDYLAVSENANYQTPLSNFRWPLIILSKVGFDNEQSQATVFLSWLCDEVECGYSALYFLEYVDEKWLVTDGAGLAIY